MARLRSLIAALLLALWLPATLHCELEAAGLEGVLGCHDHDSAGRPHCPDDPSHSIEGLSYLPHSSPLKAAAPAASCCLFHGAEATPAPLTFAPTASAQNGPALPGLACPWQFSRRAAPWPGAPSAIS